MDSQQTTQTDTNLEPDWLNPFYADRPDWDPYAPDQESDYIPDRPSWDPYAPGYAEPQLTSLNPLLLDLTIGDDVLNPNQLYFQSGGLLATMGSVNLGEPYTLWLYVANWGPFALYDKGRLIISQDFLSPGWYKVDRYAEILQTHLYQFNSKWWSNNVTVMVRSAGYPTTYSLVGRVVDQYGNGIPGTRVKISGSGGGSFSTNADSRGYYGLNVPSGEYTVTAELTGYRFNQASARVWVGTVSVAGKVVGYPIGWSGLGPQTSYQGNLGLLEGTVTDRSGKTIPGAVVSIDGLGTVPTDYQGNYRTGLIPGWYTVDAKAPGYTFQPATVQVRANQATRLDFRGRTMLVLGGLR